MDGKTVVVPRWMRPRAEKAERWHRTLDQRRLHRSPYCGRWFFEPGEDDQWDLVCGEAATVEEAQAAVDARWPLPGDKEKEDPVRAAVNASGYEVTPFWFRQYPAIQIWRVSEPTGAACFVWRELDWTGAGYNVIPDWSTGDGSAPGMLLSAVCQALTQAGHRATVIETISVLRGVQSAWRDRVPGYCPAWGKEGACSSV